MTVTIQTNKNTYTANGSTAVFAFTFELLDASHMQAYLDNTLQGGFTVSINANGIGGTVTLAAAPVNGTLVTLIRTVPITQSVTLPIEGSIINRLLTGMFDRITMICQQLKELVERSVTVPLSIATTFVMPLPEALKLLRWNSEADSLENAAFSELGTVTFTPGTGNVLGPMASSDRRVVLWDGTAGQVIKDGPAMATAGQVLTSNGVSADPSFKAVDNAPDFVSSDQTITSQGTLTLPHGLGAAPRQVWWTMINQIAELGYNPGDVVFNYTRQRTSGDDAAIVFWVDSTNINVQFAGPGTVFQLLSRIDGTATSGPDITKWKARIYAKK